MAKGVALTIGLNSVNPTHYAGWSGDLTACEADAQDMAEIARSAKFTVKSLLTKAATRKNVIGQLAKAASVLKADDVFMLSYSGHGGQIPDRNKDEDDHQDETWCLYDGQLIDDEIYLLLGKFVAGTRILVFSDSCHSGTVTKAAFYQGTVATRSAAFGSQEVGYRAMPAEAARRAYRKNQGFYDSLQKNPKLAKAESSVKASVLLFSGCQDNQLSSDGTFNGLFTGTLLQVWNEGKSSNYRKFYQAITRRMPPDQSPNYYWVGKRDKKFENQKPFTV
jgi:metacaspase-1